MATYSSVCQCRVLWSHRLTSIPSIPSPVKVEVKDAECVTGSNNSNRGMPGNPIQNGITRPGENDISRIREVKHRSHATLMHRLIHQSEPTQKIVCKPKPIAGNIRNDVITKIRTRSAIPGIRKKNQGIQIQVYIIYNI